MANEILSQLFENQKIQMQRDAALRESLDSKVTNALSRVLNDDAALNEIKENIAYTIEQFDSLAQRVYGYTHEAIVTDNLEKDYQDITTANPDLENVSAVGLLAILSDGDTVTAQGNRMFINGTEEQPDYSFSGENSQNGIEFIKVWFFEKDGSLSLTESFEYDVNEIQCVYKSAVPVIPNSYFDAPYVYANFVQANIKTSNAVKEIVYNTSNVGVVIPNSAKKVAYDAVALTTNILNNKSALIELNLPFVQTINGGCGFTGCSSLIKINYPNLKRIENSNFNSSPFKNVPQVVLPESLEYVGVECISNGTIHLILNCKDAEFNSSWAYNASGIESLEICKDWGTSVRLTKVADSWSPLQFEEFFTEDGWLRNVGFIARPNNDGNADYNPETETYTHNTNNAGAYNTSKFITVPNSTFAVLSQSSIDAAFSKGWKIQGG